MREFMKALALSPALVPWRALLFAAWLSREVAREFTWGVLGHDEWPDGWGCTRCGVIWR